MPTGYETPPSARTTTADPLHDLLIPRLEGVKAAGRGGMARCPAHQDSTASLSIAVGNRQPVVLTCHAGCSSDDILATLGIAWPDLLGPSERPQHSSDTWMPCGHAKLAEYEYRNERNELVFAVARCALKGNGCQGFRQWRPDRDSKSGKRWSLTLPCGRKAGDGLPYRLPDLLTADRSLNVLIVEGEKDADRAWRMGIPATCNAGGVGKWTPGHAQWLVGRDVVIVADRDAPGRKHALQVADSLLPSARSIDIVQAMHGKDLSDHFDGGGTLATLYRAAEYKPAPPGPCWAPDCICEDHP